MYSELYHTAEASIVLNKLVSHIYTYICTYIMCVYIYILKGGHCYCNSFNNKALVLKQRKALYTGTMYSAGGLFR